jgi:hypothetical protein
VFVREIVGVWRSAAMEKSLKEDGRVMYRSRVFDIHADHFSLLIDVFLDQGAPKTVSLFSTFLAHSDSCIVSIDE